MNILLFKQRGFSYLDTLIALFILSIAIVPALQALQTGIKAATIHESLTQQHYSITQRLENVLAEPYINLLNAAQAANNKSTPSSYSDPANQADRILVYIALYDADTDPFIINDSNTDGDNNPFTGDTANLLWIKAIVQGTNISTETLIHR